MDRDVAPNYSGRVRRRLAFLLLLGLLPGVCSLADTVTILLDLSYSMSLPTGLETRLELLADKLDAWLAEQPVNTRYALLSVESGSDVELRIPYPATARQVSRSVRSAEPWGRVDLGRSIERAAHQALDLASVQLGDKPVLVLVSDEEDLSAVTGGAVPELPRALVFHALTLVSRGRASIGAELDETDPAQRTAAQTLSARTADSREERVPAATVPAASVPTAPASTSSSAVPPLPSAVAEPVRTTPASARETMPVARVSTSSVQADTRTPIERWAAIVRWLLLAATVLGAMAVLKAELRHRTRIGRVERYNARPPTIELEVRSAGARTMTTVDAYPFSMADRTLDDSLPAQLTVTIDYHDGQLVLATSERIKINGVARDAHTVGERDQIRIGSIRYIVREIIVVKPIRAPRPRHRRYPLAPAFAALLAVVAFLIVPNESRTITRRARDLSDEAQQSPASLGQLLTPTAQPAAQSQPAPTAAAAPRREAAATAPRQPSSASLEPQPDTGGTYRTPPRLRFPRVIAPTDPLPDVDLDYLAIHAHPDDESLDFGAVIARMSAAGLTGAVLLMTDGGSGIDQYPWRDVGDHYPAHDLAGDELAAVREDEAREAIGWLGAQYYLRLGLQNHRYDSVREEIAPSQVLSGWSAPEPIARRLAAIIEKLRPDVVLSPDVPGPAFEHFEHEATGIAVEDALRLLDDRGTNPVRLHLVSIDGLQTAGYDGLIPISPWTTATDGSVPRHRQMLALLSHRTQRDASVIGVEVRLGLRDDYFMARDGSFNALPALASVLGIDRGSDASYPMAGRPQ